MLVKSQEAIDRKPIPKRRLLHNAENPHRQPSVNYLFHCKKTLGGFRPSGRVGSSIFCFHPFLLKNKKRGAFLRIFPLFLRFHRTKSQVFRQLPTATHAELAKIRAGGLKMGPEADPPINSVDFTD
ncbi:hypothetical protein [Pontibaca salina]|uniref:Uncharacterized protein n=1 Tax=Pontibaca salina TaxID=2795731 RepID=A0A934HKT3_9RHOB|nr:hypothetical protein [Pontibaca salina]MBI6630019.1 hypothetical protein [Pontibaca salina]